MANKKSVKTEVQEDPKIKKVAYYKGYSDILLLFILIVLFGFTLFCALVYIGDYYKEKDNLKNGVEVIEINTSKNRGIINNYSKIEKELRNEDIEKKENVKLENTAYIEFTTSEEYEEDGHIYFDVRYNITRNDFKYNSIATNDSDVLVRFSYSFDNVNWQYVKNVIQTSDSTLSPLMGSYYDIAGIKTNLKILTDYDLSSMPGDTIRMYWKCETFISGRRDNLGKGLNAEFKIDYKNNS